MAGKILQNNFKFKVPASEYVEAVKPLASDIAAVFGMSPTCLVYERDRPIETMLIKYIVAVVMSFILASTTMAADSSSPSTQELCNGFDDNGANDRSVDEVFHIGQPCSYSLGDCTVYGKLVCTDQGETSCAAHGFDNLHKTCSEIIFNGPVEITGVQNNINVDIAYQLPSPTIVSEIPSYVFDADNSGVEGEPDSSQAGGVTIIQGVQPGEPVQLGQDPAVTVSLNDNALANLEITSSRAFGEVAVDTSDTSRLSRLTVRIDTSGGALEKTQVYGLELPSPPRPLRLPPLPSFDRFSDGSKAINDTDPEIGFSGVAEFPNLLGSHNFASDQHADVNPGSNTLIIREVDFESSGRGDLDFKLERIYTNQLLQHQRIEADKNRVLVGIYQRMLERAVPQWKARVVETHIEELMDDVYENQIKEYCGFREVWETVEYGSPPNNCSTLNELWERAQDEIASADDIEAAFRRLLDALITFDYNYRVEGVSSCEDGARELVCPAYGGTAALFNICEQISVNVVTGTGESNNSGSGGSNDNDPFDGPYAGGAVEDCDLYRAFRGGDYWCPQRGWETGTCGWVFGSTWVICECKNCSEALVEGCTSYRSWSWMDDWQEVNDYYARPRDWAVEVSSWLDEIGQGLVCEIERLQNKALSQRSSAFNSGLADGWTFNLPSIEFPAPKPVGSPSEDCEQYYDEGRESDNSVEPAPGYVYFDGYRRREFTDLTHSEFRDEEAILEKVSVNVNPDDSVRTIAGEIRDDVHFRILSHSRYFYFNQYGQLRFITDFSKRNYIAVNWQALDGLTGDSVQDNRVALQTGRIKSIRDAAGNDYEFSYLVGADYEGQVGPELSLAVAGMELDPSTEVRLPLNPPPMIRSIDGPENRSVYFHYNVIPGVAMPQWVLRGRSLQKQVDSPLEAPVADSAWSTYSYEKQAFFLCDNEEYCHFEMYSDLWSHQSTDVYGPVLTAIRNPLGGMKEFSYIDVTFVTGFSPEEPFLGDAYRLRKRAPEIRSSYRSVQQADGVITGREKLTEHRSNKPGLGDPAVDSYFVETTEYKGENKITTRHRFQAEESGWKVSKKTVDPHGRNKRSTRYTYGSHGEATLIRSRVGRGWPITQELEYPDYQMGAVPLYFRPIKVSTKIRSETLKTLEFTYDTEFPWLVTSIQGDSPHITKKYDPLSQSLTTLSELIYEGDELIDTLSTSYIYDNYGNIKSVTKPSGVSTEYSYSEENGLAEVSLEAMTVNGQRVAGYRFSPSGRLVAKEDALGNKTEFRFDHLGHLVRKANPDGSTVNFSFPIISGASEYDNWPQRRLPKQWKKEARWNEDAQPFLELWSTEFGDQAKRVDTRGGRSRAKRYTYDNVNRLISVHHGSRDVPIKRWLELEYDVFDRVTFEKNLLGHETQLRYNDVYTGNRPTRGVRLKDSLGNKITLRYDGLNRLVTKIVPLDVSLGESFRQGIWRYQWDRRNRLTLIRSPDMLERHYEYDSLDRLVASHQYPNDGVTALSQVCSFADPNCLVERFEYLPREFKKIYFDSLGEKRTTTYDNFDRTVLFEEPLNRSTRYERDVAGNILKVDEILDDVIMLQKSFTYDPFNHLASITDGTGNVTEFRYTPYDEISEIISATNSDTLLKKSWRYAVGGEISELVNESSEVFTWIYDDYGNLEEAREPRQLANKRFQTTYLESTGGIRVDEFDVNDNSISVTYDSLGRKVEQSYSPDVEYHFSYNALGKIKAASNEFTETEWRYAYDSAGRRIAARTPEGRESHQIFDVFGRLVGQYRNWEGDSSRTGEWHYAYDSNGNLKTVTNPIGNQGSYTYDALNRVRTHRPSENIQPYEVTYQPSRILEEDQNGEKWISEYDLNGILARETDPDGFITAYTYSRRGQLQSISKFREGGSIQSESYQYTATGLLESRESATGAKSHYEYDGSGNLLSIADAMGLVTSFSYTATHDYPTEISPPVVLAPKKTIQRDAVGRIASITIAPDTDWQRTKSFDYSVPFRAEQSSSHLAGWKSLSGKG